MNRTLATVTVLAAVFAARAEMKVTFAAPPKAAPSSLQDVRLLDGPFKDGQDIAVQYLLSLEPDRFLANFHKEAGLGPKARHSGGLLGARILKP